jgi:hypothetical protein
MTVDGVWRIEMLGSDGWECVGTAFLENGRYLRGGSEAYTVGHYELEGSKIRIEATTVRFEGGGAVYGRDSGEIQVTLEGEVEDGQMAAEATDGKYVTPYRYTRLADMP